MKKKFVEPEIVRIDLGMTENIASSQKPDYPLYDAVILQVFVRQYGNGCFEFYKDGNVPVFGHGLGLDPLIDQLQADKCFYDPAAEARALRLRGR